MCKTSSDSGTTYILHIKTQFEFNCFLDLATFNESKEEFISMSIFYKFENCVSCCPFGLKRQTDIENVKHNHVNNPIKVFIFMPFVQHFKQ